MANKTLFSSALARFLPRADTVNQAGGVAYAYGPEALLAQLAATGTLSDGFYADAETQLAKALEAAETMGWSQSRTVGSAVASDAFFPFPDGLLAAAEAGATAVIQPGGSIRDDEVIAAADEAGLAMLFTGMRHFRH